MSRFSAPMNIDKLLSSSLDDIVKQHNVERQRGRGRRGGNIYSANSFSSRGRRNSTQGRGGMSTRGVAQYAPIGQYGRGRRGGGNGQGSRRAFFRALRHSGANQQSGPRNGYFITRRGDRKGPGGRPMSSVVTVVRRSQGSFLGDSPSQGGRKVNRNRSIRKRGLIPNGRFINTSLARRGDFVNVPRPQRPDGGAGWISRESSMLKKIKIVAELDRLPPPLTAQQGLRGRVMGGGSTSTMTLNERFRA